MTKKAGKKGIIITLTVAFVVLLVLFAVLYYDVIGKGAGSDISMNLENPNPEELENPRDPDELMQGIIRYEATEGLEDIGEAYFKGIMSMDDIGYTIEGYSCVKNQLLLTAEEGITFAQIEELVHSYDAEIVGYLELCTIVKRVDTFCCENYLRTVA